VFEEGSHTKRASMSVQEGSKESAELNGSGEPDEVYRKKKKKKKKKETTPDGGWNVWKWWQLHMKLWSPAIEKSSGHIMAALGLEGPPGEIERCW